MWLNQGWGASAKNPSGLVVDIDRTVLPTGPRIVGNVPYPYPKEYRIKVVGGEIVGSPVIESSCPQLGRWVLVAGNCQRSSKLTSPFPPLVMRRWKG